ncbi:ABC transporter substrate-binding protein [Polaromonas sp. P1-6]|nr:ABC transporter substrate-binding protein [Polaromonas sp. P1-6]
MASASVQAAEHSILVMQALTGPSAFVGVSVRDGMLLALEESNRKQELGAGNSLKAIVADDASDRNQSVTLLQRHATDPSVLMIMGPTSGGRQLPAPTRPTI